MSIANTAQAEHWNTGEAVAHWVDTSGCWSPGPL